MYSFGIVYCIAVRRDVFVNVLKFSLMIAVIPANMSVYMNSNLPSSPLIGSCGIGGLLTILLPCEYPPPIGIIISLQID